MCWSPWMRMRRPLIPLIWRICGERGEKDERRNSSKVSEGDCDLRLWQHLRHRLYQERSSCWNLLEVPSVLYRQAEAGRYRRTCRSLQEALRTLIFQKRWFWPPFICFSSDFAADRQGFHWLNRVFAEKSEHILVFSVLFLYTTREKKGLLPRARRFCHGVQD